MRARLCIFAALFAAASATISQPLSCSRPAICAPRVIASCPTKNRVRNCPTCCCKSSKNVEFYVPIRPEPKCTAPPAIYNVKFVGTWSRNCHPDYYPGNAHWSPPTGGSHNPRYRMWDACMLNVSDGVARVSQTGGTNLVEREYAAAGDNILDHFKGGGILGVGETSDDFNVAKSHQWVSAITMLAPSQDRMMGVSNLRLCEGHDWKRQVKVCGELFSTATKTERVFSEIERNTLQKTNCSFGYFEFTFKQYKEADQQQPKKCEFETHAVCPPSLHIPKRCRTCCCISSRNVEFVDPSDPSTNRRCRARGPAKYKVSLKSTLSSTCHPNFALRNSAHFSGLALHSHMPIYRFFDRCQRDHVQGTIDNFESSVSYLKSEYERSKSNGHIYDYYFDSRTVLSKRKNRRVGYISVSPNASTVTLTSKLLQTTNMFVGFSALQMCSCRFGWKERVEVCIELFAAVNTTSNPKAESVIQGNQCSFGSVIFELKAPRPGSLRPPPPQRPTGVPPPCPPNRRPPPRNGSNMTNNNDTMVRPGSPPRRPPPLRNMSNDSNRMMRPRIQGVCIPFRVTVPGLPPPPALRPNRPPPPRNGSNMSNDMMMRPGTPPPPPPSNGRNMSSSNDRRMRPKSRQHCMPLNESIYFPEVPEAGPWCCLFEYIFEGRVIRVVSRTGDRKYSHTLVVKVAAVHYDDINRVEEGDVVEIKICGVPERIRWNKIYRFTGTRECGSNELEISERGIFAEIKLGVGKCAPYILEGNCDNLC